MANTRSLMQKMIYVINFLDIVGIIILLVMAFVFQFVFNELPCPLCILQRLGFMITGMGFLLNLHYGMRSSHYALALLGALFTAFVALRQIALHVVPGTGGYGSSIFGLHMYTWSFIVAMAIVLCTSAVLGIDSQYYKKRMKSQVMTIVNPLLFACMLALALSNFVAVLAECGFQECPDNPTQYAL